MCENDQRGSRRPGFIEAIIPFIFRVFAILVFGKKNPFLDANL